MSKMPTNLGRWVTFPGHMRPTFVPSAEMIEQIKREKAIEQRRKEHHRQVLQNARTKSEVYSRRPTRALVKALLENESEITGIPVEQIIGKSQKRTIVFARFRIFKRLHDEYGCSLPAIGMAFGRDHTTVLNGLRRLAQIQAAE